MIPVKAEWKRRVQGVVHGASSSGQTVYVEPLETIELNNDLVRLLEEEQAEIHRIFLQMTRQIAQYAGPILGGAEVLAEVDTLLARARFAQEFDAWGRGFRRRQRRSFGFEERAAPAVGADGCAAEWRTAIVPMSLSLTPARIGSSSSAGRTLAAKPSR